MIGPKPNFYKVVEALKIQENYQVWRFMANKAGNPWSRPRKTAYIKRDLMFQYHKNKFLNSQIDLDTYIRSLSYMFDITVNKYYFLFSLMLNDCDFI